MALYGIEITSIGWYHFQKLRSSFADVFAEGRGNRNEWLACHLTDPSASDPETSAIIRCFRAMRRFLIHYPQQVQVFCDMLIHATADTHHACGPSSTIKRWITRLGWDVSHSGKIITDNQIVIDLVTTPLEFIEQQVISGWTNKVLYEVSHRQGLSDVPTPNIRATLGSITNFDDVDRKISIKHIIGAYVCANKAKHWQDHDGSCVLCKAGCPDSMSHRVFDCTFFDNIRAPYKSLIDEVKRHYPYWAFSPTVPTHPDETRLLQICSLFPVSLLVDVNDNFGDPSRVYTFFTDGGCTFPDCPTASVASWSIVADNLCNSVDRSQRGKIYQDTGEWPNTLNLVATGNVPNRQTNDRGELMAIIQCLSLAKGCVFIWSDSTYALDVLDKVLGCGGDHTRLQHCKNWDLVLYLVSVVDSRTSRDIEYNHIKAHQPLDAMRPPVVQYNILGNYLADFHAGKFLKELPQDLQVISTGISEHYAFVTGLHRGFLEFACHLTKATSAFNSGGIGDLTTGGAACNDEEDQVSDTSKIRVLENWAPSGETKKYCCDFDNTLYSSVPHPPHFTGSVVTWLRSLEWPTTRHHNDVGITWYELLIDLCISTGCYPPVTQGKWKGQYVYTEVFKGSASSLLENPLKDQIAALRSCIRAVAAIYQNEVFPMSFFTKDCKSLLAYPGGRQCSGLTIRPRLTNPSETVATVARLHLRGGFDLDRSKSHLVVPVIEATSNCQSRIICFKRAKERQRR